MAFLKSPQAVGVALIAPLVAGTAVFVVVPLGLVVWLSLSRWDLLDSSTFVGFANFAAAVGDPRISRAWGTTLLLGVLVVPAQTVLGLLAALLLERAGRLGGLYRVLLLLPWVAAPLTSALVWRWILAPEGGALSQIAGHRVDVLTEPTGALMAVAAVMVWGGVGYVSLFFTAALHAIPRNVHDAATLDGVSPVQRLRRIQLPLLRPVLAFVVLNATVQALVTFDVVYGLTGGGPDGATEVIALTIYHAAFRTFDLGMAAALSLVLFAVLAALALVQYRQLDRGGDESVL